jgi:hypothetical protein
VPAGEKINPATQQKTIKAFPSNSIEIGIFRSALLLDLIPSPLFRGEVASF